MLEDILLAVLKHRRPSRYKGIGLHGGVILAMFWAAVGGIGGWVGWNIYGPFLSAIAGALVGYRLEKVSGAFAVAVLSIVYYSTVALSDCGPIGGAILGTFVGLKIGHKTKE